MADWNEGEGGVRSPRDLHHRDRHDSVDMGEPLNLSQVSNLTLESGFESPSELVENSEEMTMARPPHNGSK